MYYNPYINKNIRNNNSYNAYNNNERFGGFVVPLLLGGIGGYAIGATNWGNNNNYQTGYYYPYPYNYQYNNYYPNYYYPY